EQRLITEKANALFELSLQLERCKARREERRDRLVAAVLNSLTTDSRDTQQTTQFLFNHFSRLTTRPQHMQQGKQAVIDLAVRGQLVRQDSNEEPAHAFLARIRSSRTSDGSMNKQGSLFPKEVPFELPHGWSWARLADVCTSITDGDHQPPPKET